MVSRVFVVFLACREREDVWRGSALKRPWQVCRGRDLHPCVPPGGSRASVCAETVTTKETLLRACGPRASHQRSVLPEEPAYRPSAGDTVRAGSLRHR